MNSLEFAIQMELDGIKYYEDQAIKNSDNFLKVVFTMMAQDEKNHAAILRKKLDKLPYALEENDTFAQAQNVFSNMGDLTAIAETPTELNLYREIYKKEKQSVDLYQDFLSKADDKEKELFEYLIKQEKEHCEILEEIITHVKRPEEWVESAEFGIREEY